MKRKRDEERDPLADSWVRVHLVGGESIVLSHVQVKLAGYLVGRKDTGGDIAYPSWRVTMLEALKPPVGPVGQPGVFLD